MSPKTGVNLRVAALVEPRPATRLEQMKQYARRCEELTERTIGNVLHGHGVQEGLSGWSPRTTLDAYVTPVGAILLAEQPPRVEAEVDQEAAAARATGWDPMYIRGVSDGFRNHVEPAFVMGRAERAHYLPGLRAGHMMFADNAVKCPRCGELKCGLCLGCELGVGK